jgi:hypothetical protein
VDLQKEDNKSYEHDGEIHCEEGVGEHKEKEGASALDSTGRRVLPCGSSKGQWKRDGGEGIHLSVCHHLQEGKK